MRSNIIKKGTVDEVRCAVTELRLSETFMDVPQLSVKVVSSTPITFEIGDYITYDYNGVTYTLRSIPEAAKNARPSTYGEAFVYNLVFYSPMWDLRNVPFLDLVLYDNGQHFTSMPDVTTYEDVYGIAARVQANMDNMYPEKWEIRVVSGLSADSTLAKRLSETQDFSLSDGKCLDALSQVYSQWGVSFVYSYEDGMHVITIGGAETQEDTSGLFMYGKGNGLKVIKASVQNASELATRLFVYGGTQNMQPRYYNGRTMEPEYIHAEDASNPTVTAICSGRRLLGDNMYVPNLMIPVSKWGRTKWYVWTASSHSQEVFTEVRNPSAGSGYAFDEPNIGASRNVISSVTSDSIVVEGTTYQYMTEVLYPDIRKAYIDAPQSYLDKYGIRPATMRFDGSGEREDIHPSIKGLTIGDIRAGLGSEAEYYPSTSVYTDPDGRVDKVLSCENPQDDGLTSNGANKYDSVLTASIGQTAKSVDLSVEETEEDDPQYGTIIRKTYVADNVTILSKAFAVSTSSKGILHFAFPLRLAAGMRGLWHVRARVVVYREDSSGGKNEIVSYEKYVHGSGENGEINLTPTAADVGDGQYSINAEETLYIDVIILSIRAEYDEEVQPSYSIVIPAYTQQWRFAISLGAEFYIKLKQTGFDISDVPTNDGESPVISMTSGQCGGYEFEIHDVVYNSSDDSWTLRCARVQDSVLGQWFPNSIFRIEPDDTFVLLNIALPEVYITANEQRLYDAALAEGLYEERPLLEPEIDSKVMAESPQVLRAGMWFQVKDTDLGLTGADGGSFLILIDGVEVTDKPDSIRSFKVTLRNNKEDNVFVRMQRQIAQTSASMQSERRSQAKTSVSETPTKGGGGDGYVDTSDFVTLSTDQTVTGKKTFANDVIFGGEVSEGVFGNMFVPSTEGPGKYALVFDSASAVDGEIPTETEGLDVDAMWKELSGSAGGKVIAKEHLPSDVVYGSGLAGYATQSWVQQQGYTTQSDLDGRINDLINGAPAAYDTLKEIADVLEGNVDSIGDILTALGGKADKATTLAGYGIKDAYTKTEIGGLLEDYVTLATPQTITGAKTFSGDVVLGGGGAKAFLPSTAGAGIYSIVFDAESAVDGEVPTESGIDMAAVWTALGTAGTEQIDASHLSGALSSYVTQTALSKGLATKVDKVSGMGLSSNDFTDTLLAKLNGIEAGANKYVLPTASSTVLGGVKIGANISISNGVISTHAPYVHPSATARNIEAATGRVLSAIVVNSLGHVTSVSYKALAAADIPNLSWTKITSGKPTTLAGYGITDGVNAVSFSGAGNAVTGASVDKHVLRLERNTTFVDISSEQTISGKKIFSGDAVFGSGSGRLFLPSTAGAGIYSIVFDAESAVDGEVPSAGMDTDAMWEELGGSVSNKVIDLSHIPAIPTSKITGLDNALASYATRTWVQQQGYLTSVPKATTSAYGGIKIGYPESGKNYPVELDSSGRAYVSVPWVNTTYSLSSFGITATAAEINKLDGIGTLLHSGNYTSYTVTKTGGGASGTWPISIGGNAATADVSNYLFLNPNNATHASQNDAVPANGRFAIYDVNMATTAGGNDGYIMAFRWPSGNWATQVFLDVDSTGIMALRHRSSTNVWTDWYRILHSGNIGSYALTPSNYASTLDSRYVNISGDTMTGKLTVDGTSSGNALDLVSESATETYLRVYMSASYKGAIGYHTTHGTYLFNRFSYTYLGLRNNGLAYRDGYVMWDAGNDGSGSGLDADLLDGYHGGDYVKTIQYPTGATVNANNAITNTITHEYRWSNTPNNGAIASLFDITYSNDWRTQLFAEHTGSTKLYVRSRYNGTAWGSWRALAFTDSNVASATKLQTSRTLWGQSFNGEGNVSGDMTGVSTITGDGFTLGTNALNVYDSTSKANRISANLSNSIARIYAIDDTGNNYRDLSLGQTPGDSGALYFDASAANWGIGTTSPAYKLDVAGALRATGQGTFDTIKIADSTSAAHLTFGRSNAFNYISLPGDSSTLAIAPGGDISGAGSALCISNSATYPGYHNGTISLGLSSYRWSNVYSVLGNFSGLVTAGSIAVTDKLYIPSSSGNNVFDAYIA